MQCNETLAYYGLSGLDERPCRRACWGGGAWRGLEVGLGSSHPLCKRRTQDDVHFVAHHRADCGTIFEHAYRAPESRCALARLLWKSCRVRSELACVCACGCVVLLCLGAHASPSLAPPLFVGSLCLLVVFVTCSVCVCVCVALRVWSYGLPGRRAASMHRRLCDVKRCDVESMERGTEAGRGTGPNAVTDAGESDTAAHATCARARGRGAQSVAS